VNTPAFRGVKLNPADGGATILEHPDHVRPNVDLATSFAAQGLQVIIKLTRTALTSQNPRRAAEEWHVDGTLNEHIVAGAVLVLENQNVTTPALDFRVEADLNPWDCGHVTRDLSLTELRAIEIVFGLESGAIVSRAPAVQELGAVQLPVGRLVAYPNVLQHRMQAVELIDKSAPGHQDILTLWLVDPHYRICSTRNVPPQRNDWWLDAALQNCKWPPLPNEIVCEITRYLDDFPVSMKQARRWKEKFREQQEKCQKAVQFYVEGYMFIEQGLY
jgi:hypothetical protein